MGYKVGNYLFGGGEAVTAAAVFLPTPTGNWAIGLQVTIAASEWNATQSVTAGNFGAIYNAAGLLHELGHIYSLLSGLGSGGSDIKYDGLLQGGVSDANTNMILKDCFGISN